MGLHMSITNLLFAKKKTRAPLWGTLAKTLNYIMILLFSISNRPTFVNLLCTMLGHLLGNHFALPYPIGYSIRHSIHPF